LELKAYADATSFPFGNLTVRDMTPQLFDRATLTEVEVPIGADNPPYATPANDKVYVGITGDLAFVVGGDEVHVRAGDVLVIHRGEEYRYRNGGYEPGRLLVIEVPED
jgi:mannose-6-phosphate isomerase-like protein (cupin superfamily)